MNATPLRYSWYVVIVLMFAYTLSFIDRQILSLLVAPIKAELSISDTQVGLLQGLAFALFYTLLGLPMGRIVDRYNRRTLIAVGVALWSLMTALCGVARSFGSLFIARMGVGVGEATLSPAALSIICDSFPRERLATAVSVYSMGIFIGAGSAFMVGGAVVAAVSNLESITLPLLGTLSPWRLTFFIVGVPGLLLALLIRTLREPARTGVIRAADGSAAQLTLAETISAVAERRRSVSGIAFGMACHAICMYAIFAWVPTFFARVHGWSPGQAGLALGAVVLVFGCAGMYAGGRLCDRWQALGRRSAPLEVGVLAGWLVLASAAAAMLAPTPALSVALLAPVIFGLALPIGSMFAALQLIFPNQLRGQISALYLFLISIIGISLGPLLAGGLNDWLFDGGAGIGRAIALTVSAGAIGMLILFRSTYGAYRADHAARIA